MKLVALNRLEKTKEIMKLNISWKFFRSSIFKFKVSEQGHIFERTPRECELYTGIKWWVIEPTISTKGYYVIGRKNKTLYVHRLVATSFLGKSELDINHIDGDKLNNEISNLEYCTSKENHIHYNTKLRERHKQGSYKNNQKSGKIWFSRILHNGKDKYLGSFKTKKEATAAYCVEYHNIYGHHPLMEKNKND